MRDKILNEIKDALMKGDRDGVVKATSQAFEQGVAVKDIINSALVGGMDIIGAKFKANEIFIPEVLISARAMHAGMAILEPHFIKNGIKPIGKVLLGTVKGDLHDIGKNIVGMMLRGACFEINDLGIDVSPQKFIDAARSKDIDIIAMSSLLTTSMNAMRDTIDGLGAAGLRDKVRIIVGGAPITQEFANSIGADGYAGDAASAVDKAKELLQIRRNA
ncbi:MAG: corrinoid protein [Candidatus Omnitrophica bacterium]|nr:corrinoid protein [Candidatus Omnitrophota bacterium]